MVSIFATTNLIDWAKALFADTSEADSNIVVTVSDSLISSNAFISAFFAAGDESDSDFDGISDGEEKFVLKTDPHEPDTDGDGLTDGWEVAAGFNPRIDNYYDDDPLNDPDADTDMDGLELAEESLLGTSPVLADTDGDDVADGSEVPIAALRAALENLAAQIQSNPLLLLTPWYDVQALSLCSNPCSAANGDYVAVGFYFGDPSPSTSEKYLLKISPVPGTGKGEAPGEITFLNALYGVCDTTMAFLKKGWRYNVTLHHASTDYNRVESQDPDYALLGASASPLVRFEDSTRLFGVFSETEGVFSGEGKVATIDVYAAEITLCKPEPNDWDEMEESRVVLDDEPLKVKIDAWPCMASASQIKSVFGSSITLATDATCPGGATVPIPSSATFLTIDGAGELRFSFTREELKGVGLLPTNEDDSINEKATTDIGDNNQSSPSNLSDSSAFNALTAFSRHDATKYGNMDASPPTSNVAKEFFMAAGVEYLVATYAGNDSKTRQLMNQADFFYASGHGNHKDGSFNYAPRKSISAAQVSQHWLKDLDCVILAGCSILDIGDFVAQRLKPAQRAAWEKAGGACSPGNQWLSLGPKYFLGYGWKAPRDTQGANVIAATLAAELNAGENPVEAWRIANDCPAGRNACAIELSTIQTNYWYWKRTGFRQYTWDCKVKGADW